MIENLSRRAFLRTSFLVSGATIMAACTPTTVEVEKEVTRVVKEVVKETVVVAEATEPEASRIAYWSVWSQSYQEDKPHAMYELTERFNEENAGEVYVDYVFLPVVQGTQLSEKLMTAIAGGTPPRNRYLRSLLDCVMGQ